MRELYLSFRAEHVSDVSNLCRFVDGFEFVLDSYEIENPLQITMLKELGRNKKIILHLLDSSVGASRKEFSECYLTQLENLISTCNVEMISDHLSFSEFSSSSENIVAIPNFIPLSRCNESLQLIGKNVNTLKGATKAAEISLENICYYFDYAEHEFSEPDFFKILAKDYGCNMLLDLNNLYINSVNHKFDPYKWIDLLPLQNISALHVAGFDVQDGLLIDTHNKSMSVEVERLLKYSLSKSTVQRVVLEWDHKFSNDMIMKELARIRKLL